MTLTEVKDYLAAHLASAEAEIQTKWSEVVAWVEGKQATDAAAAQAEADRVAAEVADLVAKGYVVTAPVEPAPAAPAAPAA